MSASSRKLQKLFGLFELDATGTVLYARIETDGQTDGAAPDVAGHNFFNEILPFANTEELRRRINAFTKGEGRADNFHFTCQCADGPQLVKVLLARIHERANGKQTKSILVHLRKI